MNLPGFTADNSLFNSVRKYNGTSAATHRSKVIRPQLRVGGGGLSNKCDDKWGDCYIDCSVRYPDSPNNLNSEFREACFDSCDASHDRCGSRLSVGRSNLLQTPLLSIRA